MVLKRYFLNLAQVPISLLTTSPQYELPWPFLPTLPAGKAKLTIPKYQKIIHKTHPFRKRLYHAKLIISTKSLPPPHTHTFRHQLYTYPMRSCVLRVLSGRLHKALFDFVSVFGFYNAQQERIKQIWGNFCKGLKIQGKNNYIDIILKFSNT